MKTLKTMLSIAMIAASAFIVGCDKELPSPEKMKTISNVVGKTAGFACELAKTKNEIKEGIVEVLDIVSVVVPTNNETFTEAWTPVIDAELKKLVEKGKIGDGEVAIAKIALNAATEGLDYVFVTYPKAKDVKYLVSSAVEGFVAGFKSVISLGADGKPEIDEEAYKFIKAKLNAK